MKTMDPPLRTKGTYCDVQHTISGDSLPSEAHPYTPGSLTHLRRSATHHPSFLPPYTRCVGIARRALICSPVTVARLSSLDALLFPLRATHRDHKSPSEIPPPPCRVLRKWPECAKAPTRSSHTGSHLGCHWLTPLTSTSAKCICRNSFRTQRVSGAAGRWQARGKARVGSGLCCTTSKLGNHGKFLNLSEP